MPPVSRWYATCWSEPYLYGRRSSETTEQALCATPKTGSRLAAARCCCSLARLDDPWPARCWRCRRHPCCIAGSRGIGRHLRTGFTPSDNTKTALGGVRGVHVRESIRLEVPLADVYGFWRRLENLPRFMTHLDRVTESSDGKSHWVAAGPAGLAVEWDAEIINEVDNKLIAWRSLPGSDVVSAGSVNFDAARAGRSTEVSVDLQYAPPAGKAGALIASLFGREPSQTIREDLRHFKQLLEAGEIPRATATA